MEPLRLAAPVAALPPNMRAQVYGAAPQVFNAARVTAYSAGHLDEPLMQAGATQAGRGRARRQRPCLGGLLHFLCSLPACCSCRAPSLPAPRSPPRLTRSLPYSSGEEASLPHVMTCMHAGRARLAAAVCVPKPPPAWHPRLHHVLKGPRHRGEAEVRLNKGQLLALTQLGLNQHSRCWSARRWEENASSKHDVDYPLAAHCCCP